MLVRWGDVTAGLTTAASIWSSSAIGILVGIDFVATASALAALFITCMVAIPALERRLPGRAAILATLRYREGARPQEEHISEFLKQRGLTVQPDSLSIRFDGNRYALEFMISASGAQREHLLAHVANELPGIAAVESFTVARTSRA